MRARKPHPLVEAAQTGDRLKILLAVRDRLIADLAAPACFGIAGVSKELRTVLAELETLGANPEVTPLDRLAAAVDDQLAERRARRGATAAGP